MATYYKYAERDADSQVNWTEVGKNISDMLAETNRIRQEKKDAIDAATRQFENDLSNAPQGQNQDINNFTNKYAHNMMNQMRIDEQLLKSGQMPLDKYTLRRQNYVDGTNQLFELSKLYQDEFKAKMEGVNSGALQALNVFNMGMVEGYADFNNSEAVIDALGDGRVNIGLYETKIIDGKTVKVLSKNIAPVNVIRGKILQNVPTFDVEAATTATVKGFGTRKDVLYKAATLSGAGSITELMGPDFLATNPDPTTQKIVKDMNLAIDQQIDSYFDQTPYNLSSVLTQNLGKYGAESFTFDKDEAAKDANKILVKVDANTNMTTLDEDGPNYKAQKAEASAWVKTNMLSKIDQERGVKPTAQLELQETAEQRERAAAKYRPKTSDEDAKEKMEKDAENFALNLSYVLTGTDAQKGQGMAYMRSIGADIVSNPPGKPAGNYVRTPQGLIAFESKGDKIAATRGLAGALLRATGAKFPEDLVVDKAKSKLGKNFNTTYTGTGATVDTDTEAAKVFTSAANSDLFYDSNSAETKDVLMEKLGNIPGIEIVAEGGGAFAGNNITIRKPGAKDLIINSNQKSKEAASKQAKLLKDWLTKNVKTEDKQALLGEITGDKAP
jgi:hypothetical protein